MPSAAVSPQIWPYSPPVTRESLGGVFSPPRRGIKLPPRRSPLPSSGFQLSQIGDGYRGTAQTIAAMRELAVDGGAHPGIRLEAEQATAGLASKDYEGELRALFDYFRDPGVWRYQLDPVSLEWLSHPAWTLFVSGVGDCFTKGTLVLRREGHELVPIEALQAGDEVWGHKRWSRVERTWDRGTRETWLVKLNNGGSVRLTPEHKVWVAKCKHHGEGTLLAKVHACRVHERELVRVPVSELRPHDVVLQPDKIDWGSEEQDPRRAYVEGLYISDGYSHGGSAFRISGRDGFPREQQKRDVQAICGDLGVDTTWQDRDITVLDGEWARRCRLMGALPWEKRALSLNLAAPAAKELLRGILADSGRMSGSAGREFTTSSYLLSVQTRVLCKALGVTCGQRFVRDHGSTSDKPVWRLTLRQAQELDDLGTIYDRAWRKEPVRKFNPDSNAPKLLRVREIVRDDVEAECFDIATDDHCVWLPECDWTTSQCDEATIALASLAMSIGHSAYFRTIVADKQRPNEFSHVYPVLGYRDKEGMHWFAADVTHPRPEDATFGWEALQDAAFGYKDWSLA